MIARVRAGPPRRSDETNEPRWGKKGLFVMLMLDEALARVQTHLDVETLHFDRLHEGNHL